MYSVYSMCTVCAEASVSYSTLGTLRSMSVMTQSRSVSGHSDLVGVWAAGVGGAALQEQRRMWRRREKGSLSS